MNNEKYVIRYIVRPSISSWLSHVNPIIHHYFSYVCIQSLICGVAMIEGHWC